MVTVHGVLEVVIFLETFIALSRDSNRFGAGREFLHSVTNRPSMLQPV